MKRKPLYLLIFMVNFMFACGISSNVGNRADGFDEATQPTAGMSTQVNSVEMVVVNAPDGLRVRPEAGNLSTYTRVLHNGDSVTCRQFETVGDSVWCLHEYGWSNVRYLEAK